MIRTVRNIRAAREEFTAAVQWYEDQRPRLGAEFFDAVTETTDRIEAHPEIGTPASPDQQTRRVLVQRFPYQVVYRLLPGEIVIIAIAHLKRRPGYWKART